MPASADKQQSARYTTAFNAIVGYMETNLLIDAKRTVGKPNRVKLPFPSGNVALELQHDTGMINVTHRKLKRTGSFPVEGGTLGAVAYIGEFALPSAAAPSLPRRSGSNEELPAFDIGR